MEPPLELQHKHLLLGLSMVPTLTYLLQPGLLNPEAACMGHSAQNRAQEIQKADGTMVVPFSTLTADMQLCLSLRLGGCGLSNPPPPHYSTALVCSPQAGCTPTSACPLPTL
jgi:hypothetical protein